MFLNLPELAKTRAFFKMCPYREERPQFPLLDKGAFGQKDKGRRRGGERTRSRIPRCVRYLEKRVGYRRRSLGSDLCMMSQDTHSCLIPAGMICWLLLAGDVWHFWHSEVCRESFCFPTGWQTHDPGLHAELSFFFFTQPRPFKSVKRILTVS